MNTITMQEFMKKTGAGKKTAEGWLNAKLIPNAEPTEDGWVIPASARRPYFPRCRPDAGAATLRTSMVRACLLRRHITPATYTMSEGEFRALTGQLEQAGLIAQRLEDGITYYDSTPKSEKYLHRPYAELKKFVGLCVQEAAKGVTYGAVKAWMDKSA